MGGGRSVLEAPLPGVHLAVDHAGAASGPVVVWLHGALGAFDDPPFAGTLLATARVLAFHQPGFGVSSGEDSLLSTGDLAHLYWWGLDQLTGAEPVTLVGHGLGAAIAAEMAAMQPGRVAGAVLAAPLGLFDDEVGGADLFALTPGDLARVTYADPAGAVFRAHNPVPADAHDKALAAIRRAQTLGTASRYLYPLPDTGIGARLYRMAPVPTRLLFGALDGVVPAAMAGRWRALLPHAACEVVQDASHMVPYECDAVSDAVLALVGART